MDHGTRRGETLAEKAYALWQLEGCPDGRAAEYWRRAQEVEERGNGSSNPAAAAGGGASGALPIDLEDGGDHPPAADIPSHDGPSHAGGTPSIAIPPWMLPPDSGDAPIAGEAATDKPWTDDGATDEGEMDWFGLAERQTRRNLASLEALGGCSDLRALTSQHRKLVADNVRFVLTLNARMIDAARLACASPLDARTRTADVPREG